MSDLSITGRAVIGADAQAVARKAADWFVERLQQSEGIFRIALSGGTTPRAFYRLISGPDFREWVPWDRLQLFWGDERFVPHDSADSNYRMAREALLTRVPILEKNIHPVPVDGTPEDAARSYETTLQGLYGATALDPAKPLFDLMLLGLGPDGHTASLIPGEPVLEERTRWVAAVEHGRTEPRITLTYPAVESSRFTAFLVTGAEKAAAVKAARAGDASIPAGRLRPAGDVVWFMDKGASAA
ncbi:MAG TPA: 6-phosphogluconolactonase [Rhizomicrobium sp.]|jgi:6-phosphogluconolactonase|nr:6-phosphogluconolactonase [Rhizomicrobium sp.]